MIQWFPGHMSKALKLIEENLKIVDSVIYVLDSRAINACFNPDLNRLIQNKPVLYCFNKADMVEPCDLKKWYKYFDAKGFNYIATNSTNTNERKKIINKLKFIMTDKINKYQRKGVKTPVRSMVIGIPNCGKSTLINSLCKSKKTATGDKPGVTRAKQWLSVERGIDLLDTPGTLWPSFDDQKIAYDLAFIGSIKDDVLDINDITLHLLEYLAENYSDYLKQRYKLDELNEKPLEIFNQIAKKRGFLISGGEIDYDRTAKAVLDDFKKQRIGKIMLEFPNNG